jgi:hypothetical protein
VSCCNISCSPISATDKILLISHEMVYAMLNGAYNGWDCVSSYDYQDAIKCQSWAFATFPPFRYSLFHYRYFITSFRYGYSATFLILQYSTRYSLSLLLINSVLRTASFWRALSPGNRSGFD